MADSPVDEAKTEGNQATGDGKLLGALKKAAMTAAVAALTPVVKKAVEGAVKKGPEMLAGAGGAKAVAELAKDKLGGDGDGGGLGSLAAGALGAVTGDGSSSGDAPDGTGSGRRMPIQQAVDVAAPIDIVYNQFTQFEEYPKFMHRVVSVSQTDEGHVTFRSKQWKVNRQWEAEIVDQRPDERIAWRSASGVKLSGVATFHELAPRLTRIEVNVDFDPAGFFEKVGRGMRFAKRAIRADLHRFKAYVETQEEEDGEWRGYVVEGEAVDEQEYFGEEMDEPAGEEELEPADEGELEEEEEELDEEELEHEEAEGEPVAEEEPVAEVEDVEEEEEEPPEEEAPAAPARRAKRSRSKASSDGGPKSSGSRSGSSGGGTRSRASSGNGASAAKGSRSAGGGKRSAAKKGSGGTSSRGRKAGRSS